MSTDATPVLVDLDDATGAVVRRWMDTLGWQEVDDQVRSLVPPVVALTGPGGRAEAHGVPTVLLVGAQDDPVDAALRAVALRPAAVLRWPDDRERLPGLVAGLAATGARDRSHRTLTVGGAAGGVGTTTVALALGGLAAWRGQRTVVVASGDVPSTAARTVEPDALSGPGAWRSGAPAPGVPGLRVVGAAGGCPTSLDLDEVDLAVLDVGCRPGADVLVLRRDAAGVAALEASEAGVAVVLDHGPVHPRVVGEAAAGRRVVSVPYSARVARAHLQRRVPAGLPGAWLRTLAPVARGL